MEHELLELEFWPVEHPLEPQDEDRPVKCPMPSASSVINNVKLLQYSLLQNSRQNHQRKE